jgi:hypothetical protein
MENNRVSIRRQFHRYWHPVPLEPPQVHLNFSRWPALQRGGEVLRYSLLRLEYWVSPGGGLREWARLNVAVALLLGIPALIVVPVVTVLLGQFTTWTDSLVQIAKNFLLFPVIMLASVALVTALPCGIRGFIGR